MTTENFGTKMAAIRRERGITGGRKKIADKYKPFIEAAEGAFAEALPNEAGRYVEELAVKDPERCPVHHRVLCCPDEECGIQSERTAYNHKAAAYIFDRIMGKPTQRVEKTLAANFVEHISTTVLAIFVEVNELPDPAARLEAFADQCLQLSAQVAGDEGGG